MQAAHSSSIAGIGAPRTVRKIDFAGLVGYSPASITGFIKRGMPIEADGRIPVAEARLWIMDNIKPVHKKREARQGALELTRSLANLSERDRLARVQAENIELKNAQMRRELVSAAEVQREWESKIRAASAAILSVPLRLRGLIPSLTAEDVIAIDAELRRVLEELANGQ